MRERHIYGKGYAVQKYPIDMDLQYDLNDICSNKMQAANIAYPDHNNAVLQYFNLILRQIEPRPRIVHKSDEFVCPVDMIRLWKSLNNASEWVRTYFRFYLLK